MIADVIDERFRRVASFAKGGKETSVFLFIKFQQAARHNTPEWYFPAIAKVANINARARATINPANYYVAVHRNDA